MKRILIVAAVVAASISTRVLADEVGVSIGIGQPGFYGRLDVGDFPQPQVIYTQPMIIERGTMVRPAIYLHVPPNHARHWKRHCGEYSACGERVFFVQDKWYNREYAPRYQEQHRVRQDVHQESRHNERRNEDRGNSRNDHRGNGEEHGRDR